MTYALAFAAVACAWAMLCLFGGERQRLLYQVECDRKRAERDAAAAAAKAAEEVPVVVGSPPPKQTHR